MHYMDEYATFDKFFRCMSILITQVSSLPGPISQPRKPCMVVHLEPRSGQVEEAAGHLLQ